MSELEISIFLWLLGASPPDPHRSSAPGPRWRTSPRSPLLSPCSKLLATPLITTTYLRYFHDSAGLFPVHYEITKIAYLKGFTTCVISTKVSYQVTSRQTGHFHIRPRYHVVTNCTSTSRQTDRRTEDLR